MSASLAPLSATPGSFEIDINLVPQQPNECGFACLAMLLRHQGWNGGDGEVATRAATTFYAGRDLPPRSRWNQPRVQALANLAFVASQVPGLSSAAFCRPVYEQMGSDGSLEVPYGILHSLLRNDVPVMVRLFDQSPHYSVLNGYDANTAEYRFADPEHGRFVRSGVEFDDLWGLPSGRVHYDDSYVMLAVAAQRATMHSGLRDLWRHGVDHVRQWANARGRARF